MNYCERISNDRNCHIVVNDLEMKEKTVYVYILQYNATNGKTENQVLVKESLEDAIVFDFNQDGFYNLLTLIVPTDDSKEYYYNNGKFYQNIREVNLQEIIDSDSEDITSIYQYYFNTCRLKKCFVNLAQEIINNRASVRCSGSNIDRNTIYKRDLVWSTLHVIKYLTDLDQYEEAARLLERIGGCNGLCPETNSSKNCGCGM